MTEMEITQLLYFYSATAQTLAAVLGIGIVALTFYASWITEKKRNLRSVIIQRLRHYVYNHKKALDSCPEECHILTELNKFILAWENGKEDYERENVKLAKEYLSYRVVIPKGCFFFGSFFSFLTIIICLFMIKALNLSFLLHYSGFIFYFVFGLAIISLICFGRLAWCAVKKI